MKKQLIAMFICMLSVIAGYSQTDSGFLKLQSKVLLQKGIKTNTGMPVLKTKTGTFSVDSGRFVKFTNFLSETWTLTSEGSIEVFANHDLFRIVDPYTKEYWFKDMYSKIAMK